MRKHLLLCFLLTGCAGGSLPPPKIVGKTVFIGDSITQYWDLKTSFPADDFINMGITAQTTSDIRARFDTDVIALNPSTVVILAGTNDILHRANDLATAKANLEFMATDAREHGIVPVVCTVPPVAADLANLGPNYVGEDFNPTIRQLNQMMADSSVLNVHCDYHTALSDAAGLPLPGVLKDGVHPSPAGYALMAAVIDGLKQ